MRHNNYYPQGHQQEIRIKSPHLLRIRTNNGIDNQRLHVHKPNLVASNGQKYYAFQHTRYKDEGVKLYQPTIPLQLVQTPNVKDNNKKAVFNKTQFDQIKELTTLESGDNQLKYRKIKHDKIKELTRNKNSQMITITSQGNNDYIKDLKAINDKDKLKEKKAKLIRQKVNQTATASNYETYNTNLMTRSKSVYSKQSKRSLDLSQSKQLKRSNSNKKDALRILDETIKGLTKLKTIILDEDEDEEEDDDIEHELELGKLRKNKCKSKLNLQLQNGIQNINDLINYSFTRESLSKNKLKKNKTNQKLTLGDNDNDKVSYHKRTITEMPKVKKQKIFIDLEKKYNNNNNQFNSNKQKNTFLIGANSHLKANRTHNNNQIENFDQEFIMKTMFNRFNNQNNNNKTKDTNQTQYNNNINLTKVKLNKSSITVTKKNKKQRYESDTDTLANFEFSD